MWQMYRDWTGELAYKGVFLPSFGCHEEGIWGRAAAWERQVQGDPDNYVQWRFCQRNSPSPWVGAFFSFFFKL